MVQCVVGSILHGGPIELFLVPASVILSVSDSELQPVLHDWCSKGSGMCYPVCGMMHIKESLLHH